MRKYLELIPERQRPRTDNTLWWMLTLMVIATLLILTTPLFVPILLPPLKLDIKQRLQDIGAWFDLPPTVAQADVLVVLGGDTDQRLEPGVTLFQQGLAREFWYTGPRRYTRSTLTQAQELGVPANAVTQVLGSNTWEEGRQIAEKLEARKLNSVLVVTSWYHGRRTLCVLHQHLQAQRTGHEVQVYYQPVGFDEYGPEDWWRTENGRTAIFSEIAKLGFYWPNYHLALHTC